MSASLTDLTQRFEKLNLSGDSDDLSDYMNPALDQDELLFESKDPYIQLHRRDIVRLRDHELLNDELINSFSVLMSRTLPSSSTCYIFNTFFLAVLKVGGYNRVKRWVSKIKLFDFERLLIPVHHDGHWTLILVEIKPRRIEYYDSMPSGQECEFFLQLVLDFLDSYHQDFFASPLEKASWVCIGQQDRPLQLISGDCGVFVCYNMQELANQRKPQFSQNDIPDFRKFILQQYITCLKLEK